MSANNYILKLLHITLVGNSNEGKIMKKLNNYNCAMGISLTLGIIIFGCGLIGAAFGVRIIIPN